VNLVGISSFIYYRSCKIIVQTLEWFGLEVNENSFETSPMELLMVCLVLPPSEWYLESAQ